MLFALAKSRFAFDLENYGDPHTCPRLDFMIRINEAAFQPTGELTPHRGFSGSHEADEVEIEIAREIHPAILASFSRLSRLKG